MRSLLTSVALTAALVVAIPATSRAQDAEDAEITKMAKEHYRLGVEAFKAGKYADAVKELKKAYLLKRLPPILSQIAKTYEKLNDLDNAIYYYKKYLAEAAPDAKDRDEIKKALIDVQARKDAPPQDTDGEAADRPGGGGEEPVRKAPPPRREPEVVEEPAPAPRKGQPPRREPEVVEEPVRKAPPPRREPEAQPEPQPQPKKATPDEGGGRRNSSAGEWTHNSVDSAPPNTCLDVKVQTPVMKGVKVWLYYRGLGESEFTKLEMKRKGADKRARIPAEAMGGKSIQYYLEAVDATGNVVKNAGTQLDPNIVFLDPSAQPQCADADTGPECAEDDLRCQERAEEAKAEAAEKERQRRARLEYCDKHPLECKQPSRTGPKADGRLLSGLGYGGIGLAAAGALVAGLGGGLGMYYATLYGDQVWNDANDPNCRFTALGDPKLKGQKCFFNDPQITPTDLDFESRGKLAGTIAPVAIGVGAAMVAGGVVMIVVDYIRLHPSAPAPPPVRKKPRRPRADEQSSIQDLLILPTVTPTTVGLDAGFRF